MGKKVLIVEDSQLVLKILRHICKHSLNMEAVFAETMADAKTLVAKHKDDIFAALVDLNLPDAPNGEVVDYVLSENIPTIVLTGSFSDEKRKMLLDKGIVDYVTKEGRYSYQYAVNLMNRLSSNQAIKVMVVDDSDTQRKLISNLLKRYMFQVLEAKNGVDAIKLFLDNLDTKLLITDFNMPQMDGVELVKNLRYKYEKSDLIIIGLSGEGEGSLSAKFIKNGANDFLQKPFCQEEFHCRIMHNVESLELIEKITDAANRDYLTGLYNRRYFFNTGEEMYQSALQNGTPLAAGIIDLDYFKKINDTYGHDVGDVVLKVVSRILDETLDRFLLARAGGEEFFILLPGLDNDKAVALMTRIKQLVESTPIELEDQDLHVSFSGGASNQLGGNLDELLATADENLYRAKESGRGIVFGDDLD